MRMIRRLKYGNTRTVVLGCTSPEIFQRGGPDVMLAVGFKSHIREARRTADDVTVRGRHELAAAPLDLPDLLDLGTPI